MSPWTAISQPMAEHAAQGKASARSDRGVDVLISIDMSAGRRYCSAVQVSAAASEGFADRRQSLRSDPVYREQLGIRVSLEVLNVQEPALVDEYGEGVGVDAEPAQFV